MLPERLMGYDRQTATVHQSRVEGEADGVVVVNWDGQRTNDVLAEGSLRVYSLDSGTESALLGQLNVSQWGGAGASPGGSPAGGAAGGLGSRGDDDRLPVSPVWEFTFR
jgi:hypothetical protein